MKKNAIFYEGNFALQDFSILSKTQKFMKAILLYKVFYFLEKKMDLESTGLGEMKDTVEGRKKGN